MGTPHNEAEPGDIAPSILLPGDPLRAKFVAENYLENVKCYNEVRGMLGFTGTFEGRPVSVQGTGMGIPSHLIYITELITHYKCQKLIRIGSCGSLQKELGMRGIIIAMSASTTSGINRRRFNGKDFAACADFDLLYAAVNYAKEKQIEVNVGNILSEDEFYNDNPDHWKHWAEFGVMAVEMETSGLYTAAAQHGVQALSILTVSDNLATHEELPPADRETSFTQMMEIALATT